MNKYRNKKTEVDGIVFDSKKEARRFSELKLLERANEILGLECQVKYPLIVNGSVVASYIADFVYRDNRKNRVIVEDCKGVRTPVYRLKAKLMKALHGIEIFET